MLEAHVKHLGPRRSAGLLVALGCVAGLLGGAGCKGEAAEPAEAAAVRASFDTYWTALTSHDGARATALVPPRTVKYFGELLDMARHGDRATLGGHSLTDRLVVLGARALFTADELAAFDPTTFLAANLTRGITGLDSAPAMALGPITVNGDHAHGPLMLGGEASPVRLSFAREPGGAWRFDLVALYAQAEDNIDGLPQQLGKSVDDWLLETTASAVGHPVDEGLWTPPLPAEATPPTP